MPIYVYEHEPCGSEVEVIQPMGSNAPDCLKCGEAMLKKPTCQALVFMKGTPSFRKRYLGTAPYTTRVLASETVKGGPGATGARAKMEGEQWLESIE